MKEFKYEEKSFTKLVKESDNLSDVAKKMGLKPFCGNRNTIKKYILKYNIDISHFKIVYGIKNRTRKDINDILIEGITLNNTSLKDRLYREGLKERKCELCGQDENWNGNKMSLILDHINGKHNDNRFKNLRIICPNCDATLSTFSGKNTKNFIFLDDKKINYCNCGEVINNTSKLCNRCDSIQQRKVERPSLDVLLADVEKLGYLGTGRKYGVSDNAIRKWIKFYKKN